MVRWEPGARERLQEAALELYATKGFEETTVVEIAQYAGLTERTFFRYFADKREVIFAGQELFQKAFIDGVAAAPKDLTPLEVAASAVLSAAEFFGEDRRAYSRQRSTVIAATPELRERELLKMAALATAIATALRQRGVPEPAATLSAESGVTVFRLAFGQWIAPSSKASLVDLEREIFGELGALTAPSKATP
ncbi:MAG: TetR family transcriptional regulator [Aeromicrobium sp.]|nr:TetR family transcriptional regulator [Aeromicrobium sp.]